MRERDQLVTIVRGRVVRGPLADGVTTTPREDLAIPRRILREEVLAHTRAEAILLRATQTATKFAEDAAEDARASEEAKFAAHYLALREEDEQRAEKDLDRAIGLAVMLAERVIGSTLAQDPEKITGIARQALAEARGARRATIEAHPLDAESLWGHLGDVGLEEESVKVVVDPRLSRGSLVIHTELGTLNAKLIVQLGRLAVALRDAFKRT